MSAFIFFIAGLSEIGGGYLIWLWLREGRPSYFGLIGGLILILYGIIATFQQFPTFSRVYAAYGGVLIVMSVFWGWIVDRKSPDTYDIIGTLICLIGVSIMLFAPRHG
ncbi:YnfA family protein [Exiguobacterium sp. PHA03]|uniref:YnfA family protein n=1 Tax=Exiguobacterium sp. PHA03 TaxID=3064895 RepID=UPI0035C13F65